MYANEIYDATGLLERIEIERTGPSSFEYRRYLAGDLVNPVEQRPATAQEADRVMEGEESDDNERARRAAALFAALQSVLGTAIGNDVVTILVGGGVVPVRAAKAAGWTPP